MKTFFAAAVLALAALAQNPAQAALTITSQDTTVAPGGSALVTFNFDFGASTSVASFNSLLSYDPLLTLTGWTASYHGAPWDPVAQLQAAGTLDTANLSNGSSASWFAFDSNFQPTAPLDLSGPASLKFSFNVASNAGQGIAAPVTFSVEDYSDANLASYGPIAATAMVTTVPEPDVWLMTLVGLCMIGTIVRRKGAMHA
jgi:hypothetical protein